MDAPIVIFTAKLQFCYFHVTRETKTAIKRVWGRNREWGTAGRPLSYSGGLKKRKEGRRPNGFLGLSLNDRTILFLLILVDKTVSVG